MRIVIFYFFFFIYFKPSTNLSELVGELLTETPAPFTFSGNPPNVEVESVSLFGGQVTITR